MTKAFFMDFETSGKPVFERRSIDPCQPHVCQVAARVIDLNTGLALFSMNRIVQQRFNVDPEARAVHGISYERSMDEGVPEAQAAVEMFELWFPCDIRLAYSEVFERRTGRTLLQRFVDRLHVDGVNHPEVLPRPTGNEKQKPPTTRSLPGDYWNASPAQCVLQLCRKHVPSVSATGKKKAPTLVEAYQHLLGVPMQGAHDAMADVDAMIAVYWQVCALEGVPIPAGVKFPTPATA